MNMQWSCMNALQIQSGLGFFHISFYIYQRFLLLIVPMTRLGFTAHAKLLKVKDVAWLSTKMGPLACGIMCSCMGGFKSPQVWCMARKCSNHGERGIHRLATVALTSWLNVCWNCTSVVFLCLWLFFWRLWVTSGHCLHPHSGRWVDKF